MTTYDQDGLVALAMGAGLSSSDAAIAAAIAMAESGGKSDALSSTGDYGLWQINKASWPQFTGDLFDPSYNAEAMAVVKSSGRGWDHWTTYRNGSYKPFLATYAIGRVAAGDDETGGGVGVGDVVGAVTDSAFGWVGELTSSLGTIAFALVLSTVGLGIAAYGLSRLASSSATGQQVMETGGQAATVAALAGGPAGAAALAL